MRLTLAPEIVTSVCSHMNGDHADSVLAYARHFGNVRDATSAQMRSIDTHGMLIDVRTPTGTRLERVEFEREISDATGAREVLVAMALEAGVAANEEH